MLWQCFLTLENKGYTVYGKSLPKSCNKKLNYDHHFLLKLNKSFTGSAFQSQIKISFKLFERRLLI